MTTEIQAHLNGNDGKDVEKFLELPHGHHLCVSIVNVTNEDPTTTNQIHDLCPVPHVVSGELRDAEHPWKMNKSMQKGMNE